MSTVCEWCRESVSPTGRRTRVFVLPEEYGGRKLYFHGRHMDAFREANPRIIALKEQETTQRNYAQEATGLVEAVEDPRAIGDFPAQRGRLSPEQLEHLDRAATWRPAFSGGFDA